MIDQSTREIEKKKVIIWLALILCALLTLVGISMGDWRMALVAGGITIACIAALSAINRQLDAIPPYRPGKGFWFYRLSRSRKIHVLTVGQVVIFLVIIGLQGFKISSVMYALVLISTIQFMFKSRISHHTPVDQASLFELEDIGVIQPSESVIGLYQDFQSWTTANGGAKILLLTPERLIAIRMINPNEGERTEIPLMDIDRLGLVGQGKKGEGLLLSVGVSNGSIIRFMLLGQSFHYSPEQFIQQFLELLDKRSAGQEGVLESAQNLRVRPEEHPPILNHPVFRPIDLHNEPVVPASDTPHQPSATKPKVIDF
ncbi:hypothetical protein [Cohnella abietis]|uniref:Uncharacterized protein n=1 Tax=Cohnella abietis TaxID=2507935 RepID=A0A3T1CYM6_9BACL|nr:hypothetical protein [Cohnella abietis]BBI30963.1 hypothetical protein KCTCHS21_03620 [Cohnella abietis]